MLLIENELSSHQIKGLITSPMASLDFLMKHAKNCSPDIAFCVLSKQNIPMKVLSELTYSLSYCWCPNKAYDRAFFLFIEKKIPQSYKNKLMLNVTLMAIIRS